MHDCDVSVYSVFINKSLNSLFYFGALRVFCVLVYSFVTVCCWFWFPEQTAVHIFRSGGGVRIRLDAVYVFSCMACAYA